MSEISNLFILPVILVALATIFIFSAIVSIDVKPNRYREIDGIRGYLATFVFLHHSAIWYYVIHFNQWSMVPNHLFDHLGSLSVSLFFMITSFLFFSKLIGMSESGTQRYFWVKLYTSRIMRIMPLYIFAVICLLIMIAIASNYMLRESSVALLKHTMQWLFFMQPDINKVGGTRYLISGVQWSLAYEWIFYCSLPIIWALFFRKRVSIVVAGLSLLWVAFFFIVIVEFYARQNWIRATPFATGIAAAFLVRNEKTRLFLQKRAISLAIVVLLSIVLLCYNSMFEVIPFCCVSIAFIAIAAGNDLFGILRNDLSILLGQISFSIYLLHPLVLSLAFQFVLTSANSYSVFQYWLTITICCLVVIAVSSLAYVYIERPFIKIAPGVVRWFVRKSKGRSEEYGRDTGRK